MGTDIHGVVEHRRPDGTWIAIRTLDVVLDEQGREHRPGASARNDERFAILAGVRGDGPASRGLPDDASDAARWLFEGRGHDDPSWLPLDEATRILAMTDPAEPFGPGGLPEFGNHGGGNDYEFGMTSSEGPDDRLVFWFEC